MRDMWVHIGRLWTSGEPFLAAGAAIRGAWHGFSNDGCDQVVALSREDTSVPAGPGRALLAGADGAVRDDSWMEAFESQAGLVAIVQASGPDYPGALARALGYPAADDRDGDAIAAGSGELAVFSAAGDGAGPCSGALASARPGPVPAVHGPPPREAGPGLLIPAPCTGYKLKVRWHTRAGEDNCFARRLLIPVQASS